MFDGFYKGRRILVTGHTGFKGSWLSQWLIQLGAEVTGLALPPATTPSLFAELGLERFLTHHTADVRNAGAIASVLSTARPEIVFHLAAQPLVRESYRDPKSTFDINVGGTVNVLEAIRGTPGVAVCVVVTTDKCYENREWPWGYREIDPMGGHDPYSASKGAAELVVASYRRSFFAKNGLRIASARAGNVIGGGDWAKDRIVTDFIRRIGAGGDLELRNPKATRPWQHVLEPLSGYLHLARMLASDQGARFAEAWNFGPDDESVIPVEALARLLVKAWGAGRVITAAASHQPHEAGLLKLDCSKAAHELGWRGVWGVAQAVNQTVSWYRQHAESGDLAEITSRQISMYARDAAARGLPWADHLEAKA